MKPFKRRLHRHQRHTLSNKLLLLFIVMALIFVAAVGGSIGHVFRSHFDHNLRPLLHKYVEYIYHDIGSPADLNKAASLARQLNLVIYIRQGQQQWSSNGKVLDYAQLQFRHRNHHEHNMQYGVARYQGEELLYTHNGDTTILFDIPNLHEERIWRSWTPLLFLLLVLMVLYHFTRRLFAPITTIREGITRLSQGDLRHRIVVQRHDELGELAEHINHMAGDIEQMLEAKRQLLLAISHELRSPITRAKVSLELLDDAGQKQQLADDLEEMEQLITELIDAERLAGQHRILNLEPIELNSLLRELLDEHYANANIHSQLQGQVWIQGDSVRLKLLFKNLLDNALRHSKPGQAVELILRVEGKNTLVEVHDHGEGIAAEHLPHLTEPFYRVDPARQRQTGGFGLGLYLGRLIVEAHGGDLDIQSQPGQGTRIQVRLPVD